MRCNKTIWVMLGIMAFFFYSGTSVFAYSQTSISVASDPRFMVAVGTKIYISHNFSGTVSILDTTDNSVTTLSVSNAWAITKLGTKVYVAKSTENKVAIIDTANSNSISEVTVGGNPGEFATGNGNVYVANGTSHTISIINGTTGAVEDIDTGATTEHIAVIGNVVYAIGGVLSQVTSVDTGNSNAIDTIPVGSSPYSITALGTKLYVTNRSSDTVSIINTAAGNSVTTVSVGHFTNNSIALGGNVYVLNSTSLSFGSNSISIINGTTDTVTATVPITGSGIDNSSAYAATIGTKIFIAYTGGGVTVFDTSDNSFENLSIGSAPYSIITLGTKAYVTRRTADAITIIGPTYLLTYSAGSNGTLSGTASQTVNEGADGSAITAVANSGYRFSSWSDGSTQNPRTDTNISGNVTISAAFVRLPPPSTGMVPGGSVSLAELAAILAPGPATTAYLKSRGMQSAVSDAPAVAPSALFTRNLSAGMSDPSIAVLQHYLNTHGFVVADTGPGSIGNETTQFGSLTRKALIQFQKAKGISPAAGYFGPITRAYVNE